MRRPAVVRALATMAGAALMAAGCGGGGGGGGATSATSVATVAVNTTPPPPGLPQLQSIVVQPTDLPAGWTAKPASPSSNQAADAAAFAQCVGAPNTSGDVVATAYSRDFVKGTAVVASTATSFKSPADVQADTSALTSPKASGCFVQVVKARLTATLPKGGAVRSVTLKITPGAAGGPPNVIATASGTVALTANGHLLNVNDDIVFLAGPRIETHIDFYNTGAAIADQAKAAVVNYVSLRVTTGS